MWVRPRVLHNRYFKIRLKGHNTTGFMNTVATVIMALYCHHHQCLMICSFSIYVPNLAHKFVPLFLFSWLFTFLHCFISHTDSYPFKKINSTVDMFHWTMGKHVPNAGKEARLFHDHINLCESFNHAQYNNTYSATRLQIAIQSENFYFFLMFNV